jgi:flagellar assembly factor FliW
MAACETRYFGTVCYDEPSVIAFPAGLPGFPQCRRFLPLEELTHRPVIFLQSLDDPKLCFLSLPVALADPNYRLKMSAEDLAVAGFDHLPAIETEAQCLAIVAVAEDGLATVNLAAPVVINPATAQAVQAVRDDAVYRCRHPLARPGQVSPCS